MAVVEHDDQAARLVARTMRASASSRRGTHWSARAAVTTSNRASASNASTSPHAKDRPGRPAKRAAARARRSASRSRPRTSPPGCTASAMPAVMEPVPQPTSSTD
ncbi:hypothetical protein WME98_03460 [Sorangium sp. So ce296]